MRPLHIYLIAVTILAVTITIYDKLIAGGKRRRIPEATLFTLSILGGSGAMYLTMLLIRHKTKHKRFMLGLPAVILVQGFLYACLHA